MGGTDGVAQRRSLLRLSAAAAGGALVSPPTVRAVAEAARADKGVPPTEDPIGGPWDRTATRPDGGRPERPDAARRDPARGGDVAAGMNVPGDGRKHATATRLEPHTDSLGGNMTAYAVGHLRDVTIGPEIVEYLRRVDATMEPYGGRFLIHGAEPDVREGEWDGTLVVIEFPDLEHARGWYESEAYRRIIPLRAENSRSTIFLVDGAGEDHRATDILT